MQRLTMSMCASRDYMQGWNDCAEKADARVAELEAELERERGENLRTRIAIRNLHETVNNR